MMKWVREFRLVPLVLIAVSCLFALKVTGLVLEGGYTLSGGPAIEMRQVATVEATPGKQSWAQQMFNYPNGKAPAENVLPREKFATAAPDITGSVSAKPKEPPADAAPLAKKP